MRQNDKLPSVKCTFLQAKQEMWGLQMHLPPWFWLAADKLHIALRVLWLFFLYFAECNSALGLEDLVIQDSQLTAQSYYESLSIGGGKSVDTEPKCARLNKNKCAWCAPRGNGQYLQVDLHSDFRITGIATQGFEALMDYYVRRYRVSHSRNGLKWRTFPVSIDLT